MQSQPATPLNQSAARRLDRLGMVQRRTAEQRQAVLADAAERERQRVDTLVLGRKPEPPAPVKLPPKPAGMSRQQWKVEKQKLRDAAAQAERAAHPYADQIALREAYPIDAHGTPQTLAKSKRASVDPIQQLYASGALSDEQKQSADQICAVAEKIGADVAVGTASLEARVDTSRRGDGGFYERLAMVRLEVAYTRWRGRIPHPTGAILDMLVGDRIGYSVAAKHYRMNPRRARRVLFEALDMWPDMLLDATREIDPATLAAAHAKLRI